MNIVLIITALAGVVVTVVGFNLTKKDGSKGSIVSAIGVGIFLVSVLAMVITSF